MPQSKDLFHHIRKIHIKTLQKVNSLFAGAYHSAFKGQGIEFEDVREYQPGDDVHSIDWNLTARMQRPYVKNFREERELTVLLAVDLSASTRFGSGARPKNETIAEIGALLAFSAIQNHDKVGLLLFSDEIELYLKPQKNLRHVLRVIREILFFKPQHRGTNIAKALSFLGRLHRRHTICFMISDFIGGTFNYKEASLMAKRHELIFIEVYDAYEKMFPQIGLAYIKDLENEQAELIDTGRASLQNEYKQRAAEKHNALKQIVNQVGAGFISVRSDQSYVDPLRKFFKLRGHQR